MSAVHSLSLEENAADMTKEDAHEILTELRLLQSRFDSELLGPAATVPQALNEINKMLRCDGNGERGLLVRVDRMEQWQKRINSFHKYLIAASITIILSLLGFATLELWKLINHLH